MTEQHISQPIKLYMKKLEGSLPERKFFRAVSLLEKIWLYLRRCATGMVQSLGVDVNLSHSNKCCKTSNKCQLSNKRRPLTDAMGSDACVLINMQVSNKHQRLTEAVGSDAHVPTNTMGVY